MCFVYIGFKLWASDETTKLISWKNIHLHITYINNH